MLTRLYQDKYFSMLEDREGNTFVKTGDSVLVVPLNTKNQVLFIVEPAPAFDEPVLYLPGGEVQAGEKPLVRAKRELQEELGQRAKGIEPVAVLRPWSKYLHSTTHIYLAYDLVPGKLKGDEPYEIATKTYPLSNFEALITGLQLKDAQVIAALYLTRSYISGDI